uniref:Uncharacterized protein n=1 Tax=Panagrolaimus superbus TaxID=310955 RepID=A0A914Y9P0_9BILA
MFNSSTESDTETGNENDSEGFELSSENVGDELDGDSDEVISIKNLPKEFRKAIIHKNDETKQQEIVIFVDNDNTLCYRYRFYFKKNGYYDNYCPGHSSIKKGASGVLEFQEPTSEHSNDSCQPSKYYPKKFKEPYFKIEKTDGGKDRLDTYEKMGDGFCKYGYTMPNGGFRCNKCQHIPDHNVYATVWKYKNREKYVQLNGTHVCTPTFVESLPPV